VKAAPIRIGCAGWALRRDDAESFPPPGTHLERYARILDAVEINSSFYRPHQRKTYERWADSVPGTFRFSVKVPKDITHEARLADAGDQLASFLHEVAGLGDKLGPLLVQLPPGLGFDAATARTFFATLRGAFSGPAVCEPRNASWFTRSASAVLRRFDIGRVAADPAPVAAAAKPGRFGGIAYYRLHGSPRMYYSAYGDDALARLAASLRKDAARGLYVWCIFDNTAAGAALANALTLRRLIEDAAG